jgi:hypothetical protein
MNENFQVKMVENLLHPNSVLSWLRSGKALDLQP